ncbi:GNAT family N-acetyltransferase [Lapillicoccus jejuensis]|uniref:RimJ/RimL family protein N-acetyltransferase n=1 Tax=Lapillicoccus jejuensis TaxID=402171 RepID=A0A542DX47_9MICO|nr:GNAT family N-acetyltransferase [Lapillicoccus jejuensis]TQJ07663.1 RimJ/RimL family protein N-acetyltransferase [Lapillicoccus jejuensis]
MSTAAVPPALDYPWPADDLTDGVVVVRAARPGDEEAWMSALTDPEARRWSPPLVRDEAQWRDRFTTMLGQTATDAVVDRVVADPGDDRFLGLVDWRRTGPELFRCVDVGYVTAPGERGRGVASRGLSLLVPWLLAADGLGQHRVQLDHAVENVGSCRTAVRGGLRREGTRTSFLPLAEADGVVVFHDICQHGVVGAD